MALTKATLIDLNSNELILDLDADTSITADTDDTIHFKIAGADELVMTGTALTPAVADGSALGSTALEWSDIFLADSATIQFGADQDVTLTHVSDSGLALKSTATGDDKPVTLVLQTGETDIAANDVLGVLNFQAPDEGTGTDAVLVAAGIAAISEGDFSSSANATKLSFRTAVSAAASETMSLTSNGDLFLAGGLIDLKNDGNAVSQIKFYCESSNAHAQTLIGAPHAESGSNTLTLPSSGGNARLVSTASTATLTNKTLTTPIIAEIDSGSTITLDATTDIILDADGGDIFFKDGGTTFGSATNTSGNLIIKSGTTTAATFSGANVTLAGTVQGTTITATTAFVPDASDGAALGTTALEFSDLFLADASTIQFGADQDVTLTHVADTGLLLNTTMVVQFRDSAINIGSPADGDLDINADDEIELNSTLIDINGNVEISGTAVTTGVHTFTAVPVFPNNTIELADIQADAVDGTKIADNAINSEHYTDGSIDTAHIAADQIVASLIADNAIDSEHYTDGSIDTAHIAADQIVASLIADDAINSEHYTDGSIDTVHIADLNVTTGKIAADAITSAKIADDAIDSEHYTDGSIDTAHLADGQVTIGKLATAVLTGATDIGAAIVDADLFLVDDGAGGTLRKTTAARIKTYATTGAITTITSLLATDIKIGEDDQTKIDFETADEIHLYAANAEQVFVSDGVFGPQTDSDVDLGTTGVRFKNAFIDTITTTGTITASGIITGTGFTAGSAVLAEAELELLDGITAGTTAASKVFTSDSNNLTAISGAVVLTEDTLSFDATQDWDVRASPVAKVTLTANVTFDAPSNPTTGQYISIVCIQDGTGSRTIAWNAVFEFTGDETPTATTTAAKGDMFTFRYNGAKWLEVGRNFNLTLS